MVKGRGQSGRKLLGLGSGGTAVGALGALAGVLALSACGSSGSDNAGSDGSSSAKGDPRVANVSVTAAKGCTPDKTTFPAGGITFKVKNEDATAVSEVELLSGQRIVGEKENLPPGFSGSFAVNVDAGTYTLYCPGAAGEKTPVTVTGKAAATGDASTSALLATGVKQYAQYVDQQVATLVTTSEALSKALQGTDLTAAQTAYMKARPYYERIEPVAESFTVGNNDLDASLDARDGDVPVDQWTGFHRIEKGLFADKSLTGLSTYGEKLVTDAKKLQSLTNGLTYKPFELANGAQELLDEVSSSKITGEEERYSHIDLLDVQGNDEGAEQAFADLQPALQKIDPALTAKIQSAFAALDKLVDSYRTDSNPSGFKFYSELTNADKQQLAAAVKAVQEPLSQVASKVANG
jgi:iron uptake system component EfeO